MRKVSIKCAHCGESNVSVMDDLAVPGVDASYVAAGEKSHRESISHAQEVFKSDLIHKGIKDVGGSSNPLPERVTGRLSDFEHGKDHNA